MPTFLLTLLLAAAAGATPPKPEATPAPIHVDGAALENAVVEATRALLRADAQAARAALDRAEEACRHVSGEEKPAWPRPIVHDDMALHMALDKGRELSARGEIEKSVETLVWVGRTCRECHARAADASGELPGKRKSPLKPEAVPVK